MGNCTSLKKQVKKNPRPSGKLSLSTCNNTQYHEPLDFKGSPLASIESSNKLESPQIETCKSEPSKKKYSIAFNSNQEGIQPMVSSFDNESLKKFKRYKRKSTRMKSISPRTNNSCSNNFSQLNELSPRNFHNPFLSISQNFNDSASDQSRLTVNSVADDEFFRDFYLINEKEQRKEKKSLKRLNRKTYHNGLIPELIGAVPSQDVNIVYNLGKESGEDSKLIQRFESKKSICFPRHRRFSIRSISCYDLENYNLYDFRPNEDSGVLMFYVPFVKNLSEIVDYRFTVIDYKHFECFYKSYENYENVNSPTESSFKSLIDKFPNRWKDAKIPFSIDKELMFTVNPNNETLYNVIYKCIQKLEDQTILSFQAYNPKEHKNFIYFTQGERNNSYIGKLNGKNEILLSKKAVEVDVLHHILHSLGFMHMHQKSNREYFSYLNKSQISSLPLLENDCNICFHGLEFGPYDPDSVLIWPSCENMISSLHSEYEHCTDLSALDCKKINFFYNNENFHLSASELADKIFELHQ